jgi:hypothetical protein
MGTDYPLITVNGYVFTKEEIVYLFYLSW